jgi:PEP-CTERM motif
VWDESVKGDLSNNPLAPTSVTVAPGLNDVIGSAGAGSPSFDPITGQPNFDTDFFTFTVPKGYELKSLVPVSIVFTDPRDMDSFIGLGSGTQITASTTFPYATGAAGLLGWLHVDPGDVGNNIMPAMGVAGMGASGFAGPLPAGDYSVWVQDDFPFNYDYRFEIHAPEPSTLAIMLAGFAGIGLAGCRTSRKRSAALGVR